jgi:DNA-directed RNA polymerase sigma subunit (sigma70/sigma32)
VHLVELTSKVTHASRRLVQEYGREPTEAEIARDLVHDQTTYSAIARWDSWSQAK